MNKLYAVDLTDINYPCILYAMRRTCAKGSLQSFIDAEQKYLGKQEIGDVLVWHLCEDDTSRDNANTRIDSHGIISSHIKYDKHYAVYEGDGLVSDTVGLGDMCLINIRIRRLDEIRTKPDGIIIGVANEFM